MKQVKKLPLTKDCHHWRRLGEVPWDLQKYWQQRHTIFSNYNEGIYMTHDAWYGVTPEPVAIQIANDIDGAFPPEGGGKTTIVDLFAGVGNNAISFALQPHPTDAGRRRWDRVVAVERDSATLACAQHNAALHGLGTGAGSGSGSGSSIVWVLGDSFEFLKEATATSITTTSNGSPTASTTRPTVRNRNVRRKTISSSSPPSSSSSSSASEDGEAEEDDGDEDEDYSIGADLKLDPATTVLFASPPWGGPGYSTDAVFDLNTMEPYNVAKLHGAYRAMHHALYLPRTSDLRQIARLAPPVHQGDAGGGDGGGYGGGYGGGVESDSDGEGYSAGQIRPQRQKDQDQDKSTKMDRKKIEVVQYCVEGASKALVAYIPAAAAATTISEDNDVDVDMEGNGT